MWIKAPSSVSSVTRKSSSNVPSPFAVTQSPPPASTLPRRRSPSNEPPVTGKMESAPRGVEPISSVADVSSLRSMSGREFMSSSLRQRTSENFVNGVDRTFWAAVATGDGNETIQERVRGMPGLEPWRRPEVVGRGINRLAACDGRDHFRRTVAQPERSHRDERAVVGQQRGAQVQFEDAVRSKQQPVGAAAGQDCSAKTRTLEAPAAQRSSPTSTVPYRANVLRC